jgi:glutamine cyclotransferase
LKGDAVFAKVPRHARPAVSHGPYTMSRNLRRLTAVAVLAVVAGLAAWAQRAAHHGPETWSFKVVAAYPHDPSAFTQGLVIHAGQLYEGTGLYGSSSLRRVDLTSGRVEKLRPLDSQYFGEGITILGDRIYQLTWQKGVAFEYALDTFQPLDTFRYQGEGWGLTEDGTDLIMSDGTSTIRFMDPKTFAVVRTIAVHDGDKAIDRLNELEFIDGEIWSNIWYDDRIVRISPKDGEVLGWIDLKSLYPSTARSSEAVLNGIAYDAKSKRLFVTGKNWPQLYEIKIVRR